MLFMLSCSSLPSCLSLFSFLSADDAGNDETAGGGDGDDDDDADGATTDGAPAVSLPEGAGAGSSVGAGATSGVERVEERRGEEREARVEWEEERGDDLPDPDLGLALGLRLALTLELVSSEARAALLFDFT